MRTLLILLLTLKGYSQEKNLIRVSLDVSANGQLKDQAESFLSRELRTLGDVQVSAVNSDFLLSVIVMQVPAPLRPVFVFGCAVAGRETGGSFFRFRPYLGHFVQTETDLRRAAESAIANFDSQILKGHRDPIGAAEDESRKQHR